MKLPDWVRGMVYNLTDYFCWEKNLSARDPSAFVTSWGKCVLSPLVGSQHCVFWEFTPISPGAWAVWSTQKAGILSLISSFIHLFCSFHQGTHHMNQLLWMSWHFKLIKRGFCRSVLQNSAVLLHLKNICVFCEIGLLFIRQHMWFLVILLEWALGGLDWGEESKIGSNVWIGWQREIRNFTAVNY